MRTSFIFSALLGLAACKGADIIDTPGSSHSSANPGGGGAASGTGSLLGKLGEQLDAQSVLDAKYEVSVTVAGIPVCSGTANLLVNVPSTAKPGVLAKAPLDVKCIALSCAFGKQVNIDSLLGGLATPTGAAKSGIDIDERYVRLTGGASSTYAPGLILMPNFSGGAPAFLKGMKEEQAVRLTDPAAGVDASGKQAMKTIAYDASWSGHKMTGVNFTRIFQFEVDTDGFTGVDKLKYVLFNGLNARINMAPLSLVSLDLTSKVSDLLAVFQNAGALPPPTGACGTPPPAPQGDSALAGLLNGSGAGAASGSGSPSILGTVAGLLVKVINVDFKAVLIDQKGLREAVAKQTEVDQLINSQTSGSGG